MSLYRTKTLDMLLCHLQNEDVLSVTVSLYRTKTLDLLLCHFTELRL